MHRFATGIFPPSEHAKTLFVELRDETEHQMIADPVCTECADKHRDEIMEHALRSTFLTTASATFAARRRRRRADAAMRQEPQRFRCASCNRDLPGAELGYVFALRNRATGEQVRFPHCEQCPQRAR